MTARKKHAEPDDALAVLDGVSYRYSLSLADAEAAGHLLRLVEEAAIPLRYLLLVPGGADGGYGAFLGLGSPDVHDLPLRLAAIGIQIERGEETDGGRR